MKNEIENLLTALKHQRERLETQKGEFAAEIRELVTERTEKAKSALNQLVPDHSIATVKRLRNYVPRFIVPTIPHWIFWEAIHPNISLDTLRIRLGIYLDVNQGWEAIDTDWARSIYNIDEAIKDRQVQYIPELVGQIADLSTRIEALKQFVSEKVAKLTPTEQTQLQTTLKSFSRQPLTGSNVTVDQVRSMAQPNSQNVEMGPNLSSMIFWWMILSPESNYNYHQVQPEQPISDTTPTHDVAHPNNNGDVPSDEAALVHYETLGSQSFS